MTKKSKKAKKTAKPMDPAEVARLAYDKRQRQKRPENFGLNTEALALDTANDIGVKVQGSETIRAQRYDAVQLLFIRGSLTVHEHGAARRFQSDLAIRRMVAGAAGGGNAGSIADHVTSHSYDAGVRLDKIAGATPTRHMLLAYAVSEPQVQRGERVNWRKLTEDIAGAYHPIAQVRAFKECWSAISEAYVLLDNGKLDGKIENASILAIGSVASDGLKAAS